MDGLMDCCVDRSVDRCVDCFMDCCVAWGVDWGVDRDIDIVRPMAGRETHWLDGARWLPGRDFPMLPYQLRLVSP